MKLFLAFYVGAAIGAVAVWLAEERTDLLYAVRKRRGVWDQFSVVIGAAIAWPMALYFAARNLWRALGPASEGREP